MGLKITMALIWNYGCFDDKVMNANEDSRAENGRQKLDIQDNTQDGR